MSFAWLKRYMPRSLYGRAALILLLPMITVQLAVSVVFIQRHYAGVTEQMAGTMALELQFVTQTIAAQPDLDAAQNAAEAVGAALDLAVRLPASGEPDVDSRVWYDLSGRVVIDELQARLPDVGPIILEDNQLVHVWFDTPFGPVEVRFQRSRVSASNPHQLLVWMVFFGVCMTFISYSFLRNQLKPIKRLAAAAAEYGRGRIVPYRPTGAVEVRAAGHAFLDMRGRIERQTQTRTMMLSGVSHDLRTPLTRLKLGLGLMEGEEVAPLMRDVDDMQHLLDAFLDFARGDAEGAPELVDPIELAGTILSDASRMHQAIQAGDFSGAGQVMLRPMAVRRAVENLIGNALRYGAEARLSVQLSERAVVFAVEDDGPGIPEAEREAAVKPFYRLDPARNQDLGSGVGLGLAIVEDIARVHGGSLRLGESTELGGLKAELILPR